MGDGEAPVAQELKYLGSMLSKNFDASVLPNPDCQIVPQETTTRHWLPNSEDARQIMPQEIAGSSHFRTRIAAPLGRPHWKALRLGRTPAPQLMGWGAAAGGGAAARMRAHWRAAAAATLAARPVGSHPCLLYPSAACPPISKINTSWELAVAEPNFTAP
jgi:hypothetical protein